MIYFVLCPGFQGATLLALLLNNHSEVLALGDTNPTRRYDQRCACGVRVSKCYFWQGFREFADTDQFSGHDNLLPVYPKFISNHKCNQGLTLLFTQLPFFLGNPISRIVKRIADFKEAYSRFFSYCKHNVSFNHFIYCDKSVLKYLIFFT